MNKAHAAKTFGVFLIMILIMVFCLTPVLATVQDEIAQKRQQIEELQRQINQYQTQIEQTRTRSKTLQNEIAGLNAKISQLTLEIKSLNLSIAQTGLEIHDTQGRISDAQAKLNLHEQALAKYLQIQYEYDKVTLAAVILKHGSVSGFFDDLNNVQTTQDNIRETIDTVKDIKANLQKHKEELEGKKIDLEQLQGLEQLEKRSLDTNKSQKNQLLKDTKGEESRYQNLVQKSRLDIQKIQDEIYYLSKNGVSAEDAVKYGRLAANTVGIRPAFLIGILEIESGLGRNVGTGNWLEDMYNCYKRLGKPSRAETEKNAFFEIINKLGLNADEVKVSHEPNYGCGGALGPAQFLPSTWLAYEDAVAQLTGHTPPNPWLIEDAFMASAIKLSRAGATSKDTAGETAAAKAYISGKPNCTSSICNYYSSAVLRKAAEIEPNL